MSEIGIRENEWVSYQVKLALIADKFSSRRILTGSAKIYNV